MNMTPKRTGSIAITGPFSVTSTFNNNVAFPNLVKPKSDDVAHPEKKIGSLFKAKMMKSLGRLTAQEKQELNESDRKVAKTVEKYLNQGEGLTIKDFEKLDQKKVSNTNEIVSDYSVEGLKRSLHTLIKM